MSDWKYWKGQSQTEYPIYVFNGVPQQVPVWIHSVNEHNRRDYEFKILFKKDLSKVKSKQL